MKLGWILMTGLVTALSAPASLIITPVDATSTTTIGSGGRLIGTTLDGSGLSSGGTSGDILTETHSPNNANTATYWLSGNKSGAGHADEVLIFELGGSFDVDTLHLWNYTRNGEVDRAITNFEISFSTNGGSTFDTTLASGTFADFPPVTVVDQPAHTRTFTPQSGVTHIRFSNLTNYGDNSYIGLSEVRFGSMIPEPGSLVLFGSGAMLILRLRRRG